MNTLLKILIIWNGNLIHRCEDYLVLESKRERQQDGKKRGGSRGSEEIKVTGPGACSSLGQKEWTIRKFFRRKALSKGRGLRITCLRAKAI